MGEKLKKSFERLFLVDIVRDVKTSHKRHVKQSSEEQPEELEKFRNINLRNRTSYNALRAGIRLMTYAVVGLATYNFSTDPNYENAPNYLLKGAAAVIVASAAERFCNKKFLIK